MLNLSATEHVATGLVKTLQSVAFARNTLELFYSRSVTPEEWMVKVGKLAVVPAASAIHGKDWKWWPRQFFAEAKAAGLERRLGCLGTQAHYPGASGEQLGILTWDLTRAE